MRRGDADATPQVSSYLKQFELYAKCLDALSRCGEGQKTSVACSLENTAFKVNLACLKDL